MTRFGVLVLLGLACSSDPVVMVTVDRRPTLWAMTDLAVTVSNEGGSFEQVFDVRGADFPLTFTVTPRGRTGALMVSIEARDGNDAPLGQGHQSVAIIPEDRVDVAVLLEPNDFLVNDVVVTSQSLSLQEHLHGRQLSVGPEGSFAIAWENRCDSDCDVFGRLFADTTQPMVNGISRTSGEFIANGTDEVTESPSIAAGPRGYLVVWESGASLGDVRGAFLGPDASRIATDQPISQEDGPNRDSVAIARTDGTYVVLWVRDRPAPDYGSEVRARLFNASGQALRNPETESEDSFLLSTSSSSQQRSPHGAGRSGGGWVAVWIDQPNPGDESVSNIRARVFDPDGRTTTVEDVAITERTDARMDLHHVAAMPDGTFLVGWRASADGDSLLQQQPLLMRRFGAKGQALSTTIRIVERTSDYYSKPTLAVRADGAIGVAWQDCLDLGDLDGSCGIRFQLFRPEGMPVGAPVFANTTQLGNQYGPSIGVLSDEAFLLAWTDGSGTRPDTDGDGIRARVIYPSLERHDGLVGARCGGAQDAPCADGLVCAGTDELLCHPRCEPDCVGGGACVNGMYCGFN